MKFALLVVSALAVPASAVFSRESASDDSSVTEAPCPTGPCPLVYEPVCATFDNRHFFFSFTNYCRYQRCLCTLNYPCLYIMAARSCPGLSYLRRDHLVHELGVRGLSQEGNVAELAARLRTALAAPLIAVAETVAAPEFPLVARSRCTFKVRNVCPARGKLRQLEPDEDNSLSYTQLQDDNAPSTTRRYPASWEQSGEVLD